MIQYLLGHVLYKAVCGVALSIFLLEKRVGKSVAPPNRKTFFFFFFDVQRTGGDFLGFSEDLGYVYT